MHICIPCVHGASPKRNPTIVRKLQRWSVPGSIFWRSAFAADWVPVVFFRAKHQMRVYNVFEVYEMQSKPTVSIPSLNWLAEVYHSCCIFPTKAQAVSQQCHCCTEAQINFFARKSSSQDQGPVSTWKPALILKIEHHLWVILWATWILIRATWCLGQPHLGSSCFAQGLLALLLLSSKLVLGVRKKCTGCLQLLLQQHLAVWSTSPGHSQIIGINSNAATFLQRRTAGNIATWRQVFSPWLIINCSMSLVLIWVMIITDKSSTITAHHTNAAKVFEPNERAPKALCPSFPANSSPNTSRSSTEPPPCEPSFQPCNPTIDSTPISKHLHILFWSVMRNQALMILFLRDLLSALSQMFLKDWDVHAYRCTVVVLNFCARHVLGSVGALQALLEKKHLRRVKSLIQFPVT